MMQPSPSPFAPPIPGVSETDGMSPDMLSPMAMMMMATGMDSGKDTTARKMEEVIRLLKEIGQSDPRIGTLTADALKLLIEGPSATAGQGGPPGMPPPAPAGGPGGMVS